MAYDLQIAMIKDTLLTLNQLPFDFIPIISFTPESEFNILEQLIFSLNSTISNNFIKKIIFFPQYGENIGLRFSSAISSVFSQKQLDIGIILGGDSPQISASLLTNAINLLQKETNQAVIGPSQKGGFYLFGTNKIINNLDLTFSKNNEFGNLIELCTKNQMKTTIFDYVFDIDTQEDIISLLSIFEYIDHENITFQTNSPVSIPEFTIQFLKKVFKK